MPSITVTKKKLLSYLQDVEGFEHPKLELEQYPTSAEVAADVLFNMQIADGSLQDMTVADLGCGPGILSIGTRILGARYVIAFEIDQEAVSVFRRNLDQFNLTEDCIDVVLCDVRNLSKTTRQKFVDTAILNPPFGTNRENNGLSHLQMSHTAATGIDMEFLQIALSMATSHVYSMHKTVTREHVLRTARNTGAQAEVVAELRFDIPRLYKRHRNESVDVAVDLIHAWF